MRGALALALAGLAVTAGVVVLLAVCGAMEVAASAPADGTAAPPSAPRCVSVVNPFASGLVVVAALGVAAVGARAWRVALAVSVIVLAVSVLALASIGPLEGVAGLLLLAAALQERAGPRPRP
ncbi:MAG TPA: hypothetical protein VGR28_03085 [Candidatus Thermoplasmatota archaeon]|jgi:hypothetical protein|nr:hypothetical protein [Candidatus Thermoplasmatota archaeon]